MTNAGPTLGGSTAEIFELRRAGSQPSGLTGSAAAPKARAAVTSWHSLGFWNPILPKRWCLSGEPTSCLRGGARRWTRFVGGTGVVTDCLRSPNQAAGSCAGCACGPRRSSCRKRDTRPGRSMDGFGSVRCWRCRRPATSFPPRDFSSPCSLPLTQCLPPNLFHAAKRCVGGEAPAHAAHAPFCRTPEAPVRSSRGRPNWRWIAPAIRRPFGGFGRCGRAPVTFATGPVRAWRERQGRF